MMLPLPTSYSGFDLAQAHPELAPISVPHEVGRNERRRFQGELDLAGRQRFGKAELYPVPAGGRYAGRERCRGSPTRSVDSNGHTRMRSALRWTAADEQLERALTTLRQHECLGAGAHPAHRAVRPPLQVPPAAAELYGIVDADPDEGLPHLPSWETAAEQPIRVIPAELRTAACNRVQVVPALRSQGD